MTVDTLIALLKRVELAEQECAHAKREIMSAIQGLRAREPKTHAVVIPPGAFCCDPLDEVDEP